MLRPNYNSRSNVDGVDKITSVSPGAEAIEWNHSPSVSPQRGESIANFRPTFDAVEVPINRTPDRPLQCFLVFYDFLTRGTLFIASSWWVLLRWFLPRLLFC